MPLEREANHSSILPSDLQEKRNQRKLLCYLLIVNSLLTQGAKDQGGLKVGRQPTEATRTIIRSENSRGPRERPGTVTRFRDF